MAVFTLHASSWLQGYKINCTKINVNNGVSHACILSFVMLYWHTIVSAGMHQSPTGTSYHLSVPAHISIVHVNIVHLINTSASLLEKA